MQKMKLNLQFFASGTIDGSSTASNCDCRIVWSSTKVEGTNQSKVTASVQIKKSGSSSTQGTFSGTLKIDGTSYSISKYDSWAWGSWHTVGSKTKTVTHNADGTKSISISANLTQTGTSMAGTYKASGTAKLDTINRASQINEIGDFSIDDTVTISITKYVSTFTDNLVISSGGTTIKTINSIVDGYSLTFSETEKNIIKGLMTSPKINLLFTLTSFNGTTEVGSTSVVAEISSLDKPVIWHYSKKDNGHYQMAINGTVDETNESPLQVYDDDGNLISLGGSGEGGTTDYSELTNKPSINGVTLAGSKTLNDLGIQPKGDYLTSVPSEYVTETELNEKGYITSPALGDYVTTNTEQDVTGAKTFKNVMKIQNGQGTGSLWIGGDVNANTLTNNKRRLARIIVPSFSDITKGATLLGFDSSGDSDLHITNKGSDVVSFGGMKKITNATSPMALAFCVANTRGGMASTDKVYPLEMDSNQARFNVQPNYNGVNLATVNDIPTNTSELTNDSGYLTSIPTDYKTKTENDTLYQPVGDYALASDIPTKVSELDNDSYYITSSSNLDQRVTEIYADITNNSRITVHAEKEYIPLAYYDDLETKQDTLVSGTNIKTINNQSILGSGNITISSGEGGTSDYNSLENIPSINGTTLVGNKSLDDLGVQAKGNYLTSIPSEYVTESELNAKGYLTEHQDITGKQDKLNIITATLTSDKSITGTATTNDIALTQYSKLGDKLSVSSGSIVIGSGVTNVLVSGSVRITNDATSGSTAYNCYIYKNDEVVASSRMYGIGNGGTGACSTPSALIPVSEGDVIKLSIWKASSNKCTVGSTGNATMLTVQAV